MFDLKNVRVSRQGKSILALDHLQINPLAFTAILGHNGSGKSTLLKLLARQMSPDDGEIYFQNVNLQSLPQRQLAKSIAYLPQSLADAAGLTVYELVRLGRFPWRGVLSRWKKEDHDIVCASMEQTEVSEFADVQVDELSGGERQRAWIAMLLAQRSPVLLLDEPTSALDLSHQYDLMQLLSSLNREHGIGIVTVLHDINLTLRFCHEVVALQKGRVFKRGDAESLMDDSVLTDLFGVPIQLMDHPKEGLKVAAVC